MTQPTFLITGATGATGSAAVEELLKKGRQDRPTDSTEGIHHVLDHVIWNALASRNRDVAEGDDVARRYPAPVAPFAAIADTSLESYRSLLRLLPSADRIAFFTVDELTPPATFSILRRDMADQMVHAEIPSIAGAAPLVVLGPADIPEMLALVEVTHPGPFGPRTHELGRYLGVRRDGKLVAMAGERMRLDGFTEVSAVCVDPGYRGQGLAADLIVALSQTIASRGDVPFLHVFSSNHPAIALYRKLGFVLRRQMHLAVLQRAAIDTSPQK